MVTSRILTDRTADGLRRQVQRIQDYQQGEVEKDHELIDQLNVDLEREKKTLKRLSTLAEIQAYTVTTIQQCVQYMQELEARRTAAPTVSAIVAIDEKEGIIEGTLECLQDLQLKLAQRTVHFWKTYQDYKIRKVEARKVHLNVPPASTPMTDRLSPGWRPTNLRSMHDTAPPIDSSDGGEFESEDTDGEDPYDDNPYDDSPYDNYRQDNHRYDNYRRSDYSEGEYSVGEESPVRNRRGDWDVRR